MYAWDDNNRLVGTSDAQGCGKDVYYDALGRVVGEDFSPCRASQAPYTPADPGNAANFEVLNTYDTYEPGQVAADATFADDPLLAAGRQVSAFDRGAHTRYSYDNRGRVRRVGRQVATPFSQQAGGVAAYAPHWYTRVPAEQDGIHTRPRRRRGIDPWDGGLDRLRILGRSRRDAGPKIA